MQRTGKVFNLEDTMLNRVAVERIDEYQMKMYEVMKEVWPNVTGYTAHLREEITEDGATDIITEMEVSVKED